jgi:hypothetical protein
MDETSREFTALQQHNVLDFRHIEVQLCGKQIIPLVREISGAMALRKRGPEKCRAGSTRQGCGAPPVAPETVRTGAKSQSTDL